MPFIKALAVGTLVGGLVWATLLIGLSLLIVRTSEPEKLILPCAFLLAACAAACAGGVCARLAKKRVLVPGLASGAALLLVIGALSLVFACGSGQTSPLLKGLLCAEFPLFSVIGARLALPKSGGKKRYGA